MKQEAITRANLDDEEEDDVESIQKIRFLISEDAKKEEIYKKYKRIQKIKRPKKN